MNRKYVVGAVFSIALAAIVADTLPEHHPECNYLSEKGMVSQKWNSKRSSCYTPYKDIDSSSLGRAGLANNISYYYSEKDFYTHKNETKLKIILNVNNDSKENNAIRFFVESAEILSKKHAHINLPEKFNNLSKIPDYKFPLHFNTKNYEMTMVKDVWKTGDGYEFNFIIKDKLK